MNIQRPLDLLMASRYKRVVVDLKNGSTLKGQLQSFDIHINLVLYDTDEHKNGQIQRKLGKVLVRGDNILLVSQE